MIDSIQVVVVEPNIRPYQLEVEDINDIKTIVGGNFEIVKWKHLVILYDKEAKTRGAEFNRRVGGVDLYGTFIISNMDGDKFTDVKDKDFLLIAYGKMLRED